MKIPRLILALVILVLVAVIVICIGFFGSSSMAYPQPEYSVDSLSELREKLEAAEETYILPEEALLVEENASYTVYLKDRFHDDPSGYQISFEHLSVHCRLLSDYPGDAQLKYDREYEGIQLELTQGRASQESRVRFILNDCIYEIISGEEELAIQIAKSMIDRK